MDNIGKNVTTLPIEGKFDDLLNGQIAIAFSEDPVAPAKVI